MNLRAIACAATLTITTPASAQIPVTDPLHLAATIANQIATVEKWVTQAQQMTDQIESMREQYVAVTGARNLGQVLNNPLFSEHLPPGWLETYRRIENTGVLTGHDRASGIRTRTHVFDACSHHTDAQRVACQARAVKGAIDSGLALDAYDRAASRVEQIQGLMALIDATADPKAIAEVQGRIAAEQANIENEQTKLQLYAMVASAEDRLLQQRSDEISARTWAGQGSIVAEPMTFGGN